MLCRPPSRLRLLAHVSDSRLMSLLRLGYKYAFAQEHYTDVTDGRPAEIVGGLFVRAANLFAFSMWQLVIAHTCTGLVFASLSKYLLVTTEQYLTCQGFEECLGIYHGGHLRHCK